MPLANSDTALCTLMTYGKLYDKLGRAQSRTFLMPCDDRGLLQKANPHASQPRTLFEVALVELGEIFVPENFLPVIPQLGLRRGACATRLFQWPDEIIPMA